MDAEDTRARGERDREPGGQRENGDGERRGGAREDQPGPHPAPPVGERPPGALAADLQRLAARSPQMQRSAPLPPMPLRRMVRSWTWLRFAPWLPDRIVAAVDRHFEALLPLLALPLLAADMLRAAGARLGWRWLRSASLEARSHGHAHG